LLVFISSVYIFIGEHLALVDFMRYFHRTGYLSTGDYMVISIDDAVYDPDGPKDQYMIVGECDIPCIHTLHVPFDSFVARQLLKSSQTRPSRVSSFFVVFPFEREFDGSMGMLESGRPKIYKKRVHVSTDVPTWTSENGPLSFSTNFVAILNPDFSFKLRCSLMGGVKTCK
jgi:hypothetical protein